MFFSATGLVFHVVLFAGKFAFDSFMNVSDGTRKCPDNCNAESYRNLGWNEDSEIF